jgi:hypothetical protein
LLVEIFEACGHSVADKGFAESGAARHEVDCYVRVKIDGRLQTIAADVKAGARPAGVEAVHQAFSLKSSGPLDRAMVISRHGFSDEALCQADTVGLGEIDLLRPSDLRGGCPNKLSLLK